MTSDDNPGDEPRRQRFDEVASLFGTIVPPAGTPVRPPPPEPRPVVPAESPGVTTSLAPAPPAKPARAQSARPPELRTVAPPTTPRPAKSAERTGRGARAQPAWPDAFQPRPNWKSRRATTWSWLLLVPVAAIAAVGIATLDPKTVRSLVDSALTTIRGPQTPVVVPSLLPAPFRPGAATSPASGTATPPAPTSAPTSAPTPVPTPAPSATPSSSNGDAAPETGVPQPTSSETTATPDSPEPTQAAPLPDPTPATRAATPAPAPDPVPAPAAAPAQAPAQAPPQASAAKPASAPPAAPVPPFAKATILYRKGAAAAEAEARHVAASLGAVAASTDLRPATALGRAPAVTYFSDTDKDAATALARSLSSAGSSWIVRAGPTRPAGNVEITIP